MLAVIHSLPIKSFITSKFASVQNWVGTDLVRLVRLEDNKITLMTPPISVGGQIRTTELVWERLK